MIYLFYTSVLWAAFLVLYIALYRKETFFKMNRVYLLGTLLLGLLLPLLSYAPALFSVDALNVSETTIAVLEVISVNELVPSSVSSIEVQDDASSFFQSVGMLLMIAYSLICLVLAMKWILGIHHLILLSRKYGRDKDEGIYIVRHNEKMNPFSFWNTIYINPVLSSDGLSAILKHEAAHLKQWHSIDLIFSTTLKLVLWWNPLVHLYDKLIKENHEFLADAHSANQLNKAAYIKLLVGLPHNPQPLVHPFVTSSLKKRIEMLLKEKSSSPYRIKYCILLPLLLVAVFFFSCQSGDSNYEVGAAVESLIQKSTLKKEPTDYLSDGYFELKEMYPNHIQYIQARLAEHTQTIGVEMTFPDMGINGGTSFTGMDNLDDQAVKNYPILVPIAKSNLKEVVSPGPRFHPIKKKKVEHRGTDYVANIGSPVYAAGGGIVTKVKEYNSGYGKNITIDHGSDMETFYAHLSLISVEVGDRVKKGMKIGEVGVSGAAVKPHLHFELTREGEIWTTEVLTQTLE